MSTGSALEITSRFLDAIEARDFEAAATYLSNQRFSYRGPLERFDDTESFINSISRVGTILKRIERRRAFADGAEVCWILTITTTLPDLATLRIAQWITVDDGKITAIEVFFDARAYASMFDLT